MRLCARVSEQKKDLLVKITTDNSRLSSAMHSSNLSHVTSSHPSNTYRSGDIAARHHSDTYTGVKCPSGSKILRVREADPSPLRLDGYWLLGTSRWAMKHLAQQEHHFKWSIHCRGNQLGRTRSIHPGVKRTHIFIVRELLLVIDTHHKYIYVKYIISTRHLDFILVEVRMDQAKRCFKNSFLKLLFFFS